MKPITVGILGLGTVGCGVVNVLQRNYSDIIGRTGREIQITHAAVRDLNKQRPSDLSGIRLTDDPFTLTANPDIDIIIELLGGEDLSKQLVLAAIEQGKPVITANKALIAKHGNDIFAHAAERGVMVAFEAAVAGGIPIIKTIRESLAGNSIKSIAGIINGTSNFILSAMTHDAREFSDALQVAQKNGYAEADPTFDIDGTDIAHKLTILAAIAFGIPLQFDRVYKEGIENITQDDIQLAKELGYTIKQLGFANRTEEGIELRVHPTLIPSDITLAHVNGVMNALSVVGDAVGPTMYYGAGAGADPTSSSVIADLVDVVRTMTADPNHRVPHLAFQSHAIQNIDVLPFEQSVCAHYLRMLAEDKPGVLADITRILGALDISIESILQREQLLEQGVVPIVIITHRIKEKNIQKAIEQLAGLPSIDNHIKHIRLEHLR